MSIRTSNDHIRNKLHKVTTSLQAIQKCLGRGRFTPKSILKKKNCPPAKSALIVKETFIESSNKVFSDFKQKLSNMNVSQVEDTRDLSVPNRIEENRDLLHRRYGRSWSVSESGSKTEIDMEDFPSYQKQKPETYGSNRSINSIFKLHQTLNSSSKSRSKSGSLSNLKEKNYNSLKIYPLFQLQDKYYKPIRPNSLFISQRNSVQFDGNPNNRIDAKNPIKKNIQSTQSLDKYLSSISNDQDKRIRSEKAAEAIDSCILLMMNLVND